jgi:hypothetical protein
MAVAGSRRRASHVEVETREVFGPAAFERGSISWGGEGRPAWRSMVGRGWAKRMLSVWKMTVRQDRRAGEAAGEGGSAVVLRRAGDRPEKGMEELGHVIFAGGM